MNYEIFLKSLSNRFLKKKTLIFRNLIFLLFISFFLFLTSFILIISKRNNFLEKSYNGKVRFENFLNEKDFKSYLTNSSASDDLTRTIFDDLNFTDLARESVSTKIGLDVPSQQALPERISQTNVQVVSVEEPDIVKTDGKSLFFSIKRSIEILPRPNIDPLLKESSLIFPSSDLQAKTKVLSIFPPSNLAKDSEIPRGGNLLLIGEKLIILEDQSLFGYDISDRKNPKEVWKFDFKDSGNRILHSRLLNEKIYIVTQRFIDEKNPCPIPLGKTKEEIFIDCTDIFHPTFPIPVDTTYSFITIDPSSGSLIKKLSFVGSSDKSVFYMNPDFLYLSVSFYESFTRFYSKFLNSQAKDIIPESVIKKIISLEGYDISSASKLTELHYIMDKFLNSYDADERKRIENELENRIKDYSKKHSRELIKTLIVKVDSNNLDILATGQVPGTPLNQFSLDEYKGNLRIATNTSGGFLTSDDSLNDVYVLDKNLVIIGQVLDLGLSERIYSVRFVEDKGFLVTFRQTDPFYVIDLKNPKNPVKSGELKIPGFSSYLHPINKDKILGIGREDQKVKISLFDVSDPSNPTEVAKYNLSEFWSSIETTHHAFLFDDKHKVFFLPAGSSGYIFSFKDDRISLLRVVSDISVQRAIYIDDFMYVIGDSKIVVLNESDWTEVNSLSF